MSAFSPDEMAAVMAAIIEKCDLLEQDVLRRKLVVAAGLDAQRPGGVANPDASALAWLQYVLWLSALHTNAHPATEQRSSDASASLERALAAALADKPVAVACADGETRYVYPKSYDTLRFLDQLQVELEVIVEEWSLVRATEDPTAAERAVAALAPRMESMAVRLWAWILCDERARLPFREDRPLPALPEWTSQLAPEDLVRILHAHLEVNARRLQVISSAFPADPADGGGSKLTLAGFLGSIAAEREPGAARRLIRGTSLGQIFASQVAAAGAHREARAKAKESAA